MRKAFGYSCKRQAVRLSQCRYVQFFGTSVVFRTHTASCAGATSQCFAAVSSGRMWWLWIILYPKFKSYSYETFRNWMVILYYFHSWWGGLHTGLYEAVVCVCVFLCGDGQTFTSTTTRNAWKVLLCLIVAPSMGQNLKLKTSIARNTHHASRTGWRPSFLMRISLLRVSVCIHCRTYETLRSCPSSWQRWIQILVV